MTFTSVQSSCMIFKEDGSTSVLIFRQTDQGITFDDAPESTIQLCTFLLKISKVKRKGGTFLQVLRVVACGFLPVVSNATLSTLFTLFTGAIERLPLS
jgi:hypothetical protein